MVVSLCLYPYICQTWILSLSTFRAKTMKFNAPMLFTVEKPKWVTNLWTNMVISFDVFVACYLFSPWSIIANRKWYVTETSGNGIPRGDKLILRGLKFHGFHGVKSEEKKLGQKFLVDVDAWMDLRNAGKSDLLSDTVSYTDLYRWVIGDA